MTLKEIVEQLDLTVCCPGNGLSRPVRGGYAGDLLSDVMANCAAGSVWVTMQVHVNIVAVAVLKDLPAIILVNGRTPAEETLAKAEQEGVSILSSKMAAFETAGKLYALGIGQGK